MNQLDFWKLVYLIENKIPYCQFEILSFFWNIYYNKNVRIFYALYLKKIIVVVKNLLLAL